jgi:gamma-glutamyltranspeptidase/glutathione hydrolase
VAAAFAQCVVDPLMCTIGGTAVGLVRRGPNGPIRVVDAAVTTGSVPVPEAWIEGYAGRAETIGRYIVRGEGNQIGHGSVMVPGFVRGMQHLFERYGSRTIAWHQLLQPAIRLAAEGFTVYRYVARFWADTEDRPGYPSLARKLAATPDCGRIFRRIDGRVYQEGDRLVQADLAQTLGRLADQGPDEFYAGETGRRIAADFAAHGGLFTAGDLRGFQVLEYPPVEGVYRGLRVTSTPPPASGAQLIEMLQVAEAMNLAGIEYNGPQYLDYLARIMAATFFEHASLKLDPPYTLALGVVARSLDPAYARRLADVLRARRPEGPHPMVASPGTTHVSVADGEGSVVSLTHSVGSIGGSGVVTPGTGILFNNFLGHFDPRPGRPDSITAGKRGGGGCPAVLFEGDRPRIVIGAPGGSRLIAAVFQVLLNVIDRAMPMPHAVAAPRCHSEEPYLLFIEPPFPDAVAAALRSFGYRVQRSTYMARVQGIEINSRGEMTPGADPRGGAGAVAVEE